MSLLQFSVDRVRVHGERSPRAGGRPGVASDPAICRRRFLGLVGVAATAGACGGPAAVGPASFGDVSGGNVRDLPEGTLRILDTAPACIGRDQGGVYAMTLTCPHAGCDIGQTGSVGPQGLVCGCHGSRFDANGSVQQGPASSSLDHFAVTMDAQGELTIHGGQIVSADQRLALHM
jgi:Rieske Fe-S protein